MGVLALLATCGYPFIRAEWSYRGIKDEYLLRQGRYDAIVQILAKQGLAPDTRHYFFIRRDRDPASLRPLGPNELDGPRYDFYKQACLIEAYWESDGRLVAFFVTGDLGAMAGAQGLVYSVAAPRQGQFGLGGRHDKIGTNWWSVWH